MGLAHPKSVTTVFMLWEVVLRRMPTSLCSEGFRGSSALERALCFNYNDHLSSILPEAKSFTFSNRNPARQLQIKKKKKKTEAKRGVLARGNFPNTNSKAGIHTQIGLKLKPMFFSFHYLLTPLQL